MLQAFLQPADRRAGGTNSQAAAKWALWPHEDHRAPIDEYARRHAVPDTRPYDPAVERFNDGKADPQGRFWVGTIDDARAPDAQLFRYVDGSFEAIVRQGRSIGSNRGPNN